MRSLAVTETMVKPTFESRLSVFRVRANFVAPYRKCKFFYLDRTHLKSKNSFIKRIEEVSGNWPNGTYFLKMGNGHVFARYDMFEGKVRVLYKDSPVTSKPYIVWYFLK